MTNQRIPLSEPQWVNGQRAVTVYWKVLNDRYRIIHLNEHGTVRILIQQVKGATVVMSRVKMRNVRGRRNEEVSAAAQQRI